MCRCCHTFLRAFYDAPAWTHAEVERVVAVLERHGLRRRTPIVQKRRRCFY